MYILIDHERMVVTHRHENKETIGNFAHVELGNTATVIMKDNHVEGFKDFSDFELKMLYTNLCGQTFTAYNKDLLTTQIIEQCKLLPESNVNELELGIQAQRIERKDKGHYKYKPSSNDPEELEDKYKAPALVSVKGYVPNDTVNFVPKTRTPATIVPVESTNRYLPNDNIATTVRLPRVESDTIKLPPTKGATKMVWDIANSCYEQHPIVDKELRGMVASKCEEAGINPSTVSVQFSKWKQTKNI